jgi:aspartate kinase
LLDLAEQVSPAPPPREMDMLLTAGERISNALVAMAISALGAKAISFTGSQAGMITTAKHGDARIVQVTPHRLRKALDEGNIVLVAGFQGVSQDSKDVTTLGRGGSDTTAVALAAALEADVCEIYTDVDGIFSADPRIVADARLVADITYEEMLEMAASGAKVLHLRAVEYARRYQVPLRVRSSYNEKPGSLVTGSIEEIPVEDAIITGVAHDRSEAKITIVACPTPPGWRRGSSARWRTPRSTSTWCCRTSAGGRGADGHHVHAAPHGRSARRRRAARRQAEIGFATCWPTATSARSRWSAPGCATTRASRRPSARRCRPSGSTSRR